MQGAIQVLCFFTGHVQILEKVMDRRLPSTLAALYGPRLTCRLALAQAHLLVWIADSILLLPNYTNLPVYVDVVISPSKLCDFDWSNARHVMCKK